VAIPVAPCVPFTPRAWRPAAKAYPENAKTGAVAVLPGNGITGAVADPAFCSREPGNENRSRPRANVATTCPFENVMADSDHMYRDAVSGAAACVLGDVELRHGTPRDALAAYRRAWHAVQENPRITAYSRIAVRAQAGLAAA